MTDKQKPLGRIMLRDVRIAFASAIFTPESVRGGKPRYSANFLLPPDHPQVDKINSAMKAVAKAKWGDDAAAIFKRLEKTDKLALHDGDLKSKYAGFAGNLYVAAASQEAVRPTVLHKDGRTPIVASDGIIYSGCYVNVSLEFWAQGQESGFGERINAQLRGVQFLRDGESFGGGQAAEADEFEDLSDTGEDDNDDLF